jgi:xanthine dehydrogenase accessory factor
MDLYEEIVRLRQQGRKGALATILAAHGAIPSFSSAKMLIRDDGSTVGTIGGGSVESEVIAAARRVIDREKAETMSFRPQGSTDDHLACGGSLDIFIEPIAPPTILTIFGGGHVGWNVYRIARLVGMEVVIVDDREACANRERFPEAREVLAESWDAAFTRLQPTSTSYLLIVTSAHHTDLQVLRWAVTTKACYIGMIGAKRKVDGLFRTLEGEGVDASTLGRVHAPVGLDIGAATPEEIAVSIMAEIIAIRRHSQAALPSMRRRCQAGEDPAPI